MILGVFCFDERNRMLMILELFIKSFSIFS